MNKRTSQVVVIVVVAAIMAVGAGVAVAGGGLGAASDRQAFLNDVAKRLNVTPAELKAALEGAYADRLDAAVAAGKLTKEQADALKLRAKGGGLPLFGLHHRGGFGGGPGGGRHGATALAGIAKYVAGISKYLGLTPAELRAELAKGKTLAQIAKAQGKSVDGLTKQLAAGLTAKLDAAVKAGRLTQAQADEVQTRTTELLDDLVNGKVGLGGYREGFFGHRWGAPPSGSQQPPASFFPVTPAGSPA